MSNMGKLSMLLALLLVLAGCASFTAKPSIINFQGASWKISSVETMKARETWLRPMRSSDWRSPVLLLVTFEVRGDPLPVYREKEIMNAFSNIALSGTHRKAEQIILLSQEKKGGVVDTSYAYERLSNGGLRFRARGPISGVQCIFSVDEGTTSVRLILPDSQTIKVSLKR